MSMHYLKGLARDNGFRIRSRAELRADLIAGCRSLGQIADTWQDTGRVDDADLTGIDRTITGLHSILIALRAQGGNHAA